MTCEHCGQVVPNEENGAFEKKVLRDLGLPENYKPRDENEAYRLMVAWMEG